MQILVMKICILLLLMSIALCQDQFQLIFNDEFDTEILNQTKWIIDNEEQGCSGNSINQLNCNTNNSENLILADDVLAIKAIKQQYKDNKEEYTSAKIISRHNFTYGRFEIRAALPVGKMLRPAMFLSPTTPGTYPEKGQIDIMTNAQTAGIGNGAHFNRVIPRNANSPYTASVTLDQFNTYAIEWTKSEIRWFFNKHMIFKFDISETQSSNGYPFNNSFQLVIHLGVGGDYGFPGQDLSWYDSHFWECSALILDYVRIYEWAELNTGPVIEKLTNFTGNSRLAPDICRSIMPANYLVIISVLIIALILFIPIVIYLLIRYKRVNEIKRINRENSVYYDNCEVYDRVGPANEYEDPIYNDYDFNKENSLVGNAGSSLGVKKGLGNSYLSITNLDVKKQLGNSYLSMTNLDAEKELGDSYLPMTRRSK